MLLGCVTLGAGGGRARADVPPPDDKKYVGYAFQVDGVAKFPDRVIVAYPWSMSNGAPTREAALAEDGKPVSVGRRSAPPVLYAVKREAWDTFVKTITPDERDIDAKITPFLAASGVKCNKQPSMQSVLPKSDPRNEIVEAFQVKAIDDKVCDLGGATAAVDDGGKSAGDKTATDRDDVRTPSEPNEGAPPKGGCAGCATASADASATAGYGLAALAFGMLLHLRRNKRWR